MTVLRRFAEPHGPPGRRRPAGLILLSVFAPVITQATLGWGRDEMDFQYILAAPSARHPWAPTRSGGTSSPVCSTAGASRSGSRSDLVVYMVLGSLLGAIAGYFGGWVDNVIMRLVDVIQSFPFLLLALTIVAIRGPVVVNSSSPWSC